VRGARSDLRPRSRRCIIGAVELIDVERIVGEVADVHACHTAILYGSWALGTATRMSDIDVLLVRSSGPTIRDARIVDGVYLDAFVYADAELAEPGAPLLRILGGRVIRERDAFGTGLLARLRKVHEAGPPAIAEDERQMILLWPRKMLERILGQRGIEAEYRRMQLLMQCVEDYFSLRGEWFPGPKQAFERLRSCDTPTYSKLEAALHRDASDQALVEVVRAVYEVANAEGTC
jgi:uncharacterized protein